jgi:fimbrial isopeptide formation D2 family protein
MEKEIANASTITSGQTILYNVIAKNTGGNSVPDTTITDKLSSNLTYVDGDTGCTYDNTTRVVTCTIGTLAAGSEAQRSFRAKVTAAGNSSIANTAEVSSTNGQRDSCNITMDATGKVVVTIASPIPTALPVAGVFEVTVGTVGIGVLLLITGALGLLLL